MNMSDMPDYESVSDASESDNSLIRGVGFGVDLDV
jgi:hypothetical protein